MYLSTKLGNNRIRFGIDPRAYMCTYTSNANSCSVTVTVSFLVSVNWLGVKTASEMDTERVEC